MTDINWHSVQEEVATLLSDLVRFNTTNPPGNETPAAQYLAAILHREGLEAEVVESAPGRGSVVGRLRSHGQQPVYPQEPPLLLLSHLDVVPAEADKWDHDPFGGQIIAGYVWGRGTVDCKGLTAIELMALLLLARQGVPLRRDIIFAATADEETGGQAGVGWLMAHRPELLNAGWCLNEGGGEAYTIAGKTIYTVQTAEKGTVWLKLTARGPAGHGSIPRPENAVLLLARAVQTLGEADLPLHSTPTMERFLDQMADLLDRGLTGQELLHLAHNRAALRQVMPSPFLADMLYAMVHNTVTPTMLKAGERVNVIPSVAEGWLDGRILPGQTPEGFLEEVRAALGDLPVELSIFRPPTLPLEAPAEGELYDAIRAAMARHAPEGMVVPFLVTGATDAKHLAPAGIRVYGFFPMREDPQASPMELAHSHNERISLENLVFGTKVLYDVLRQFCGAA